MPQELVKIDYMESTDYAKTLPAGISVVVPVYNSATTLAELVERIHKHIDDLGYEFEIILVNDGSRDGSWEVIETLAKENSHITAINLARNFGQHNALLCGIREARYSITVTLDDDLQNPPEEIAKLIEELKPEIDVVYGVPRKQKHGLTRVLASAFVKWALKVSMNVDMAPDVQPFRAFRTNLRRAFANHSAREVCIDVLLSWGTSRFSKVFVKHQPRFIGKSNYSFIKLLNHAFNMITGYSTAPLKFASLLGIVMTFLGGVMFLFTIASYFIDRSAPQGFYFIVSLISIFSGAQFLFLGIAGEYIGRIYNRTMDCPPYVIQSKIKGYEVKD